MEYCTNDANDAMEQKLDIWDVEGEYEMAQAAISALALAEAKP